MTNEQKIIATKLGLLKLAARLGNVSEAMQVVWDGIAAARMINNQPGEAGVGHDRPQRLSALSGIESVTTG